MLQKIGLGGGCHWCTEAIFQSLRGVSNVQQGWIASREATTFSEAILLDFDPEQLPLAVLLKIHLSTHSSTSSHRMRYKYRSAIYVFSGLQKAETEEILQELQKEYSKNLITRILEFHEFRLNSQQYLDYYRNDPGKPFCRNVISPKLKILLRDYQQWIDPKIPNRTNQGKE